jgi:hypothetical protein
MKRFTEKDDQLSNARKEIESTATALENVRKKLADREIALEELKQELLHLRSEQEQKILEKEEEVKDKLISEQ